MIKNERQYRITRAAARRFANALAAPVESSAEDYDPIILEASQEAIASQLSDLEAEIAQYEALKTGTCEILEAESLTELPETLIKARIASGLSQRELGERLGLKEQQIQRYEATDYSSANLRRLVDVANALNVQLRHETVVGASAAEADLLLGRLADTGLPREFVLRRLASADAVEAFRRDSLGQAGPLVGQICSRARRVFGWTAQQLLGEGPNVLDPSAVATARFKVADERNEKCLNAYTVYAHYLVLLLLKATEHVPVRGLLDTAEAFYSEACVKYATLTLENALRFVWSLGIPVLPLNDKGAFDGAYWRIDGRHAIVLKQANISLSRWLFDLLHDYRHATQHPEMRETAVIETPPMSAERRESVDEADASEFAGKVILAGNGPELIQACEEQTGGKLQLLKTILPDVAQEYGVDVGALANFMAFKLSLNGENWWGAAANLQQRDGNPWETARDVLLEHADLNRLPRPDQELLKDALTARTEADDV